MTKNKNISFTRRLYGKTTLRSTNTKDNRRKDEKKVGAVKTLPCD